MGDGEVMAKWAMAIHWGKLEALGLHDGEEGRTGGGGGDVREEQVARRVEQDNLVPSQGHEDPGVEGGGGWRWGGQQLPTRSSDQPKTTM